MLLLEPLDVCYHRELVLVTGSAVLLPLIVLLVIVFFISLGKLCIFFLSMVATIVIVASALLG